MPALHDLSIRQLEYIVAVADTLGFHRAAERCNVSQPSLSAQVQQVEEVLGLQLFERDKRRVLVTPAGADVVARARRVLVELTDLVASAARARDPFAATFRLGVIPTVAPYLLPDVTRAWASAHPALRVVWREEATEHLLRHLAAGELDAGLLAVVPELHDLCSAEIAVDPFVVAMPHGHALSDHETVTLADLEALHVLLLDDGHCFRTQALSLCARAHAHEASFRATSLSTLAQMVSSGAGVTLLPSMAVPVENRSRQLAIRPLAPGAAAGRTIALVWRPSSPYASTFETLAATVRHARSTERHSSDSLPSVRASSRHQARTSSKAPGKRR
jgi:LysR family hydrogen peroxide-inducible transcriptional activator